MNNSNRSLVPSTQKDGKPAHLKDVARCPAGQECYRRTQEQSEIIEGPDTKYSANIELLHADRADGLSLLKKQLADEESAKGKKERETESASCLESIHQGRKNSEMGNKSWKIACAGECVVKIYEQERKETNHI
jgi:hypothetical protein